MLQETRLPEPCIHFGLMSLLADIVAKVENRATRKISRKLIFRPLCRGICFSPSLPRSVIDFGSIDMVRHNASAAPRIFDTKKTFATLSTHSDMSGSQINGVEDMLYLYSQATSNRHKETPITRRPTRMSEAADAGAFRS
jgi:hypothetical protein